MSDYEAFMAQPLTDAERAIVDRVCTEADVWLRELPLMRAAQCNH